MGWKASMIFIKNAPAPVTDKQLLDAMWQYGWTHAINPDNDKTYIARLNSTIVICNAKVPMEFIGEDLSVYEKGLSELTLNQSEICGITLQSTVNHWGYGIIQNGKKIRVRCGNYEMPLSLDYGNVLPEEEALLSRLIIREDGSRLFKIDDSEYTEDQVGEEFVFEIIARYTGYPLANSNNPLEGLIFKCYEKNPYFVSTSKAKLAAELTVSDAKYAVLEPEQYGYGKAPLVITKGVPADIKKYTKTVFEHGICNPAYVYQMNPLMIVAYSYEIDCVIPILFPKNYQPPIALKLNQRLLSVNTYGRNNNIIEDDLNEGSESINEWKNFSPHIAELYSDDILLIEEKKASIEERYWLKLPLLTKEYFEVNPKRYRLGLNGYTGFRLEYTKPEITPSQQNKTTNKKWWKFWSS
jgi:hypothetical protein